MKQGNRKKKKKLEVIKGILYIFVFLLITTPVLFFYGPYKNTRKVFISTLLGTRHRYLLTDLFSEEVLNRFQGIDGKVVDEEISQDLDMINVKYRGSDEIKEFTINKPRYDAHIIEIKNPFAVKVAMTKYLGKRGQRTSEMAEENNAIVAINGGSFVDNSAEGTLYAGTGAEPGGFVVAGGEVIYPKGGYDENTIENVVGISKDGKLVVGDHSLKELKSKYNIQEAMCFRRPNIIIDGVRKISNPLEDGLNPRTAMGQKADGTIIFLVIDGRKVSMPGASLYDVQEIMMERGAINARALDGGYSSTLYYEGEVINSPNAWDGERTVATAFYVE
ncbi:phosphodiester glycosidase family protein [Clostridium sp. LP20]|uniref:phosphodiester glycosidase family protein n=1 Tax=Clostridium sp. LP20 TaxID=3418665 RepID=UPI003EE42EBC